MVSNKKDKTRPKKEKPKAEESESESESDGAESEEEVVESAAARRKRERGRTAFLRLIRRCIVMIPLALVLGRQPFLKKERGSGVNAMKMRPLEVAIAGAVHFAADSPTFIRKPHLHVYLNQTGRALLTPYEWFTARQSKRATDREKTISGAYKKTEKAFSRLVDRDTQLKQLVTAPQPNMCLIGSALIVVGSVLCPLAGGLFEYVIVVGCLLVRQGGAQLGMEAQPEFWVAGGVAALAIMAMEGMGKSAPPPARKVKRR